MSTISSGTTLTTALVQTGDTTGDLVIKTNNGNTTAMTITTAGNVGIGTSSPGNKLAVGGGITVGQGTNSGYSVLSFIDPSDGSARFASIRKNYDSPYDFRIRASNSTTKALIVFEVSNNTEAMRLDTSGNLQFNSGYGSVATAYGCRAWVNFNGTGTVAIRASGNISSITDDNVGRYTVNFTTAMPNANYGTVITHEEIDYGGTSFIQGTPSTSAVSVACYSNTSGQYHDTDIFCVSIFR